MKRRLLGRLRPGDQARDARVGDYRRGAVLLRSTAACSSPVASADPVVSSGDKNPDEAEQGHSDRGHPFDVVGYRAEVAPADRLSEEEPEQACQEERGTWPSPLGHEVAHSPIQRTSGPDPHASRLTGTIGLDIVRSENTPERWPKRLVARQGTIS